MKLERIENGEDRKKADALVLPCWIDNKRIKLAVAIDQSLKGLINPFLDLNDFKAKEGEVVFLYRDKAKGEEQRILLLGLGDKTKLTTESLRCSYGALIKYCLPKKYATLNIAVPPTSDFNTIEGLRGVVEGLLLTNYLFTDLKGKSLDEHPASTVKEIRLIGVSSDELHLAKRLLTVAEGIYLARDLVNGNADTINPAYLSKVAQAIAKKHSTIELKILNKNEILKNNLHLLAAVSRGASVDPAFIVMKYKGNIKSKEHVILVGKGVTYDTGGLNLKPTGGIETMKCDMAGAATCLGLMQVVAELKLKVNFSVVIPATENAIDARSFKPGDVYSSYDGTTVEMTNSDAEGRLILADGLAYAVKNLKPTILMDIATLTGAIDIALGPEATGLMCSDDQLAKKLIESGNQTYERVWRMPLFAEYKDRLKSDIADIKSWNGRQGSSNVAATFLHHFVGDKIPWAHFDIASTAFLSEPRKYQPKYGTGVGIRLLINFLEGLKK